MSNLFACCRFTPLKTKMEPKNQPFGKETNLPNLHYVGSMLVFGSVLILEHCSNESMKSPRKTAITAWHYWSIYCKWEKTNGFWMFLVYPPAIQHGPLIEDVIELEKILMNPICIPKETKSLLSANEQLKCAWYKQVQTSYALSDIHVYEFSNVRCGLKTLFKNPPASIPSLYHKSTTHN